MYVYIYISAFFTNHDNNNDILILKYIYVRVLAVFHIELHVSWMFIFTGALKHTHVLILGKSM